MTIKFKFKASYLAAAKIRSSTELTVISLRTLTSFFCPILCARSWACRSWCGFQSESKMTTVSAVWRLRPKPPARVDKRKMKYSEFAMLKIFNISPRSSLFVMPSSLDIKWKMKWKTRPWYEILNQTQHTVLGPNVTHRGLQSPFLCEFRLFL